MTTQQELDRALGEGSGTPMPDNVAPGILGERPVDFRKVDTYQYEGNAGVVQENSGAVRLMWVLILYMLVVTVPVALWLLWRDRQWATWKKAVLTALMALGYAYVAWRLLG